MKTPLHLAFLTELRACRSGADFALVTLFAGPCGIGKSFTARAAARLSHRLNADPVRDCRKCGGRIVYQDAGGKFIECDCPALRRPPFTVELVYAFATGRAQDSLHRLFAMERGFDERAEAAIDRIAQLIACDLLIVDELRADGSRGATFNESLASLLDQRAEKKRPTWIITNDSREALAAAFGARLFSRIVSPAKIIKADGKDRRKQRRVA